MNKVIARIGAALVAAVCVLSFNLHAQHGLLREVYPGFYGSVSDLTNDFNFPDNPASVGVIENFEAPQNAGDNYGQRVRGYIVPPVTGNYVFWVASDDQSQLFLSTDSDPANVRMIASVPFWTDPGQYDAYPEQQSAPMRLEAGKYYYIEALMVEGGGSDHLSARWELPDGTIEEPIPGSRLYVELIPPQITRNPANIRVTEGGSATFTVQLVNVGPVSYQWQRGGVPISGETNQTLFLPTVSFSDNGARFRVVVTNEFGTATSTEAVLSVDRDVTQPTVVSAQNPGENDLVTVTFSEPVSRATATNLANYSIPGLTIQNATLDESGKTVLLKTSPQTFGQSYEISLSGIQDLADQPNEIEPDTRAQFAFSFSPLPPEIAYGRAEPLGPSTRRSGLIISEIMYNPLPRPDGWNLEFVELYNSQEFIENIGGYRIAGVIDFTFPSGTFIPARGFLVVAPNPTQMQTVYGLPRVYGGFTNSLPNDHGHLELRDELGALLLEVKYDSQNGWPLAADGAGHSLVLARPSYGEGDPRAWSASLFTGGSPGAAEPTAANPYASIVINEFLAHTDDPQVDFIELFNYSSKPVDITGIFISDDPHTNKFQLKTQTILPPLGFIALDQNALGFSLSSAGERIIVRNRQKTQVIDAIRFGPQANGISMGRFPDGSPEWRPLSSATPGTANAAPRRSDVVINEIMYHPATGNDDDQYIELYNRSGQTLDLGGWRMENGISFTFPRSTTLSPASYLVVARNLGRIRTNYPYLNPANSVGDFSGSLSHAGEKIALARPEPQVITNADNKISTNINYVVVDSVEYRTGGRWPQWADGGGSSLELVDPDSDNDFASNWADSDESKKGQWVTIQRRGILDHGMTNFAAANPSRNLQIFMMGPGEMLVDNVSVVPDGGTNVVSNPTLESGLKDWLAQGTHEDTTLETSEGFQSKQSLHIRSTGRGDLGADRARVKLTQGLTNRTIATIRADVRWVRGNNQMLLRLHGNYLEAEGTLPIPRDLGTPGKPNSRAVANAGPVITRVIHYPILPVANQSVTVSAYISDPDRIAVARLLYHLDTTSNYVAVPMIYDGGGFYSGAIPGQADGAGVGFYIEALDTKGAVSRFPNDAPAREGVIRFNDPTPSTRFGKYRLWLTQKNIDRWTRREKSSNKALDATFIYNDYRVVYDMGTLYSGSPFHWGGYQGPLSSRQCNYLMLFPEDDLFLGQSDFVLNLPSNIASDRTAVREQIVFWMAQQIGQPHNYRRYHHLILNGVDRGAQINSIFEDSQQPNSDFVQEWFPGNEKGSLHKIEDWFEFSDSFSFGNLDAELIAVITTNLDTKLPELKKERYRWWWRKRATHGDDHDYSDLFELVDAVNNPADAEFVAQTERLVDIDEWMGAIALRHAVGDWDAYGYRRGKNMYAYKPPGGKWHLMHWDIAFAFGLGDAPDHDLFDAKHFDSSDDKVTERMMAAPQFRRAYLRALYEIANGPMVSSTLNPVIEARSAALTANGIPVQPPDDVKSWIESRRSYILSQLAGASSGFSITSNNGNNFSTNRNNLVLTGTAGVQVKTILINGVEYPVTWTSVNTWSVRYALIPGANNLQLQGLDLFGKPIASAQDNITISVSGNPDQPAGKIVFNEINYHPAAPGTAFVELHNTSKTTAFDLTGWRINGLDFTFAPGSIIPPSGFAVVANDSTAFGDLYGFTTPLAGEFNGTLDNGGETLTLERPDASGTNFTAIASVTYDDTAPWPLIADGAGASLQLVDPTQDSTRVGNWASQANKATPGQTNSVRATFSAFPLVWVNEVSPENPSGPADGAGEHDAWVELYNSGAASVDLSNLYLTSDYNNLLQWQFPSGSSIAAGEHKIIWLDAQPAQSTGTEWHTTFSIPAVNGSIALVGKQNGQPVVFDYLNYTDLPAGRSYGAYPEGQAQHRQTFYFTTPGAPNNPAAPPVQVVINEWMASNTSTIADPFDQQFDDWVELYNPAPEAADVSGFGFTDDLTRPALYQFPNGTVIPPHGFLLMWADNNNANNGQIHLPFRLKASGETIALSTPAGEVVDKIVFTAQTSDVSQGRLPDGAAELQFFTIPTPGSSNTGGGAGGNIHLSSPTIANGQILLTWNSEAGATYTVEFKTALTDTQWQTLQTVTATGATSSVSDNLNQLHRFYRVTK